jgi:hypothetical protein
MMAPKPDDRKDPKRARVVVSKGREVVGPGYSRVTGVAAKAMNKNENSGNHERVNRVSKTEQHYPSWVNQVSQNSNTDQQTDQVDRVTQVSPSSNTDRRIDQSSQISWVGSTEQKIGGSNRIANTDVRVMENSANTKSRIMKNSANMESWAIENLANMQSRVSKNLVNTQNWVIQDSVGKK